MAAKRSIRWGILATGEIAHQFAADLPAADGAELLAVGSRELAKAEKFAGQFKIPRCYNSYDKLLADKDIDAIYVATPHPLHVENTIAALQAGKAVLCEKPFAVNAAEARRMIAAARQHRRFCMEAMWTRFLPVHVRLRELLGQGAIGQVQMLTADFGFASSPEKEDRLFNPAMAGGSLLDVGVYPIALSFMVLGPPSRIIAQACIGPTGVDERAAMIFRYGTGALALLSSAIATATPQEAILCGSEGRIRLPRPWWRGEKIILSRPDREDEVIELPIVGNGLHYEADEVARCLRKGLRQSRIMPLAETLKIARTMDRIRRQWKLSYPFESHLI
jgi:predicted dehydrogenase